MERKRKETKRTEAEKQYLANRLTTVDGQVKGIIKMVDDDRFCGDILIQVSAVISSLKGIGERVLKDHLTNCLADEINKDNTKAVEEVISLFQKIK